MTGRPPVVRWSHRAMFFGALVALEAWLGFGNEARAALIAAAFFCLQRGDANSRQWNVSDEQAIGPKTDA